jgi:hypothetical protein
MDAEGSNVSKAIGYFWNSWASLHDNILLIICGSATSWMISNVIDSKKASFGITYNQATERTSAEYGLNANANLLNNRMIMSTRIGYYDDRQASAYNNIYGDLTVEYFINEKGTWRVKAFTYIGERDDNYYYYTSSDSYNNYVAGVALAYKQDFDSIRRKKDKEKTGKTKSKTKSKANADEEQPK